MSNELSTVAYHEAGHAVVAVLLGGEVVSVTLEPDNDDLPAREGDVSIRWHHRGVSSKDLLRREITVCLAGPAAEMLYEGERPHPATVRQWRADWEIAWQLAAQIVPDVERRMQLLELLLASLCQMLDRDDCWQAVAEVADQLEAFETLEGEQVVEIVGRWVDMESE